MDSNEKISYFGLNHLIKKTMNTLSKKLNYLIIFIFTVVSASVLNAQEQIGGWNPELKKDAKAKLDEMITANPGLKTYLNKSYGYAVFPKVTKAGLGIGGAGGKGVVYQNGNVTGQANLSQASIGLQAGGQQYSEVIFFENKEAYDHFINNKLKFDAQATAVALDKGASVDVAYKDGVAVFTKAIGGLMFEASLGGQHFKFKPKK
jgi:lipid-binding SYLF domain-containing protein